MKYRSVFDIIGPVMIGITSQIPCDDVIEAMYRIAQTMPTALKETGQGGLAAAPTGRRLEAKIFGIPRSNSESTS